MAPPRIPPPERDIVLIVDDVPENLAVLSDTLDSAGYMVLVAPDGAAALDRLQRVTPDIILLDAVMPGIDGFETCRLIKTLAAARHVPVIFMTGLTETEHVVRGFMAGGVDYVTKPIRPEEVLARIEAHLSNARLLMQAQQALDLAGQAVLVAEPNGASAWQTPRARRWLLQFFPDNPDAGRLPPEFTAWTARLEADEGQPRLLAARDGCRLVGHMLARLENGELLLLLTQQESDEATTTALMSSFRLTGREAEVLMWVARGKTNRDIGDILDISPRTVNKHLDHIYAKLGVETRTAAAALAANRGSEAAVRAG